MKNVDLYIKQLHFKADLGIQNWTLTMKTVDTIGKTVDLRFKNDLGDLGIKTWRLHAPMQV